MRKNKFTAVFLWLVMTVSLATQGLNAADVSARSAIVIEADSGRVIYEKDADTRRPMASTTKIMTALLAIESGRLSETVAVPDKAVGVEGSSIYLEAGDRITLLSLVKALMLESANDAAEAIAITLAGSVEQFASLMNNRAAEMGLCNTHFSNPHGLSDENHYTTARELALLSAYAMNNTVFREIVGTKSDSIEVGEKVRHLANHNKMLRLYDGAIGVKTGFTKVSGRCLVSAAERDGMTLVAVTLDAPDDWNDHAIMLDMGFDSLCRKTLINEREFAAILPCLGGESDELHVENRAELSVLLPRDHGEITSRVLLPRYFFAPAAEGDKVGRLEFYLDGMLIGDVDLYASEGVRGTEYKKTLFERIFD